MNGLTIQDTAEKINLADEFFENAIVQEVQLMDGSTTKIVVLTNFQISGMEALNVGLKHGISHLHNVCRVRSFFGKVKATGFNPTISTKWIDIIQQYK